MWYKTALYKPEEGYAVSCPGLPGAGRKGPRNQRRRRTFRTQFEGISLPSKNCSRAHLAPMFEK